MSAVESSVTRDESRTVGAAEKAAAGYEEDFYAWAQHQEHLLKERRFEELDLPNLIEEIEDLSRSELRSVQSWVTLIQAHLACLGWCPKSDPRAHWEDEIGVWRLNLDKSFKISPSLKRKLADGYDELWQSARRLALNKLKRDGITQLPDQCPFTLEQVLDLDYYPAQDR